MSALLSPKVEGQADILRIAVRDENTARRHACPNVVARRGACARIGGAIAGGSAASCEDFDASTRTHMPLQLEIRVSLVGKRRYLLKQMPHLRL